MVDETGGPTGGKPCEVFIGGVPVDMTSEKLQSVMQTNFGPVASVNWRDGRTFQFVTFTRPDTAATALAAFCLQLEGGHSMQIRPAKRQKSNPLAAAQPIPAMPMLPMHMAPFPLPVPMLSAGGSAPSSRPLFSESDKLTNYKLVVSNLAPGTTQEDMKAHFAQFGTVVEVQFQSAGSCTVRMEGALRRGEVVMEREHTVKGAAVEVQDSTDGVVFVSRVPTEKRTEELLEYFSSTYGAVAAMDRPKDTGYLFVAFEEEAVAARAIAQGSDEAKGFTFGHAKPRANRRQQQAQRQQQQAQRQQQHLLKRSFDQMMMMPPAAAPRPVVPPVRGAGSLTLHVSNLPLDLSPFAIAAYFSAFGACTPADVKMMFKQGKPQNYCFVTMSNAVVPAATLLEGPHLLGGALLKVGMATQQAAPSIPAHPPLQPLQPLHPSPHAPAPHLLMLPSLAPSQPLPVSLHPAAPHPDPLAGGPLGAVGSTYTLHVSNLPPDASPLSLSSYFSQFGSCSPADVRMMLRDGAPQNYCFVTISRATLPMQLLLDGRHLFGPVQLQVRVAKHQASPAPPPNPAPLW